MRLAFFVQMIDPQDTIRGFIPGWIRALAKEVDELAVISQETPQNVSLQFGPNVRTYSLGKEEGKSKWAQFATLVALLMDNSKAGGVDAILTHMNPTYSVACSPVCRIKGIPLYTWYAHKEVSLRLKIATAVSKFCFSASEESFRLDTAKRKIIGHGIDVLHFDGAPDFLKKRTGPFRFNSACRLSPSKRVDFLLSALQQLHGNWQIDIAGEAPKEDQKNYAESLKKLSHSYSEKVNWQGAVPYTRMPQFLKSSDIHINVSATGSLDKGVLEAIAVGQSVLTSNEAFKEFLKGTEERTYLENPSVEDLTRRLQELLDTPRETLQADRDLLMQRLLSQHSLDSLAQKIVALMK